MHPVKGQPGQRSPGRYLHREEPIQLPAALLADCGCLGIGFLRPGPTVQQVEGAEQLPDRDRAAGDVLAVVARVVPTARDVVTAVVVPARVQLLRLQSHPRWHRIISAVGCAAHVSGRAAVAGCQGLLYGGAGPHQVEEAQRLPAQVAVQL